VSISVHQWKTMNCGMCIQVRQLLEIADALRKHCETAVTQVPVKARHTHSEHQRAAVGE